MKIYENPVAVINSLNAPWKKTVNVFFNVLFIATHSKPKHLTEGVDRLLFIGRPGLILFPILSSGTKKRLKKLFSNSREDSLDICE